MRTESRKGCVCARSLQSYPTLCNPMDYSPPDFSVHGILQARILESIFMPSSRGSSPPRDQTREGISPIKSNPPPPKQKNLDSPLLYAGHQFDTELLAVTLRWAARQRGTVSPDACVSGHTGRGAQHFAGVSDEPRSLSCYPQFTGVVSS